MPASSSLSLLAALDVVESVPSNSRSTSFFSSTLESQPEDIYHNFSLHTLPRHFNTSTSSKIVSKRRAILLMHSRRKNSMLANKASEKSSMAYSEHSIWDDSSSSDTTKHMFSASVSMRLICVFPKAPRPRWPVRTWHSTFQKMLNIQNEKKTEHACRKRKLLSLTPFCKCQGKGYRWNQKEMWVWSLKIKSMWWIYSKKLPEQRKMHKYDLGIKSKPHATRNGKEQFKTAGVKQVVSQASSQT